MQKSPTLDVFQFLDYREFLRAFYRAKKESSRGFSFRSFARRAGMKSPNHLKRVMDGERNLSDGAAVTYAEVIGLEGDAATYFCDLVRFNQAGTSKERSAAYRRITEFRGYRRAHRLDQQQDRYHSEWYIPAVREMLGRKGFRNDPAWIAQELIPTITEKQAAEALAVLEDLGMVLRDATTGELRAADDVVSTGPETRSVHVVHYHRAMMDMAMQSIDNVQAPERDISAVTLCVSPGAIPALKERIREFRKELIAMEAPKGLGDRVVQIGIQIFPLTKGHVS